MKNAECRIAVSAARTDLKSHRMNARTITCRGGYQPPDHTWFRVGGTLRRILYRFYGRTVILQVRIFHPAQTVGVIAQTQQNKKQKSAKNNQNYEIPIRLKWTGIPWFFLKKRNFLLQVVAEYDTLSYNFRRDSTAGCWADIFRLQINRQI